MTSALRSDCPRCFGLCCVAPAFSASSDFAIDKAHGEPCPNLGDDFRCTIHRELRERGFRGCQVFECYGAGQHISQTTYGGRSWRQTPGRKAEMFAAFGVARELHEVLAYLEEAANLPAAAPLERELHDAFDDIQAALLRPGEELAHTDVDALRAPASVLLRQASQLARTAAAGPKRASARHDRDHLGARLRGRDLRGADLRGALLIAADLRRADLRHADLLGADLRDTELAGADLRGALFLTDSQLTAARGDASTRLPEGLRPPMHWR